MHIFIILYYINLYVFFLIYAIYNIGVVFKKLFFYFFKNLLCSYYII